MPELTLFSVFLVGLLGGVHCAGMCGGIAAVLGAAGRGAAAAAGSAGRGPDGGAGTPAAARTIAIHPPGARAAQARGQPIARLVGYNLGRIVSYAAAGAIAGTLGSTAALVGGLLPVQQAAFVATSAWLIATGLYLAGALGSLAFLERAGRALWRLLAPTASRLLGARGWLQVVAAGMVWGLVPCGMVYGVLVAALIAGSALEGAALMLAFGLGTLPNLVALGWSAHALGGWLNRRGARVAAGILLVAFGVAGLARIDPTQHLHRVVDACLSLF